MRFFVSSVHRKGDRTVIELHTDVPPEDVKNILFTPGDTLEFNRQGDRVHGSLFVETSPPGTPPKRVINTTESILKSAEKG